MQHALNRGGGGAELLYIFLHAALIQANRGAETLLAVCVAREVLRQHPSSNKLAITFLAIDNRTVSTIGVASRGPLFSSLCSKVLGYTRESVVSDRIGEHIL